MQNKLTESLSQANKVLHDVFGYAQFRDAQQSIISNILNKQNTLAIMPTGGGKSICYQIPAILSNGLTIVISPLISLMEDQVRQLIEWDVPAAMLNSALSPDAYQGTISDIRANKLKLLFLAPETVLQTGILDLLKQTTVTYIAIDEAHCISEWGHEFRPEYRQLYQLTEQFPQAIVIALTATATPRVREDIRRQLGITQNSEYISSFDRPNLYIEVLPKDSPYQQTKAFIDKHPQLSGIIYCQSRSAVDELSARLQSDGYAALPYHAGLNSSKRSEYQEKFIRDDVNIIVATVAFGMGINKPDVRFVLHYDLPKNIESYYQQIGRAGRDGMDANCLLLFGYGDTGKIRYFIDQMFNEQEKRLATMHLNQMLTLAETEDCRRLPLLQYFGEQHTQVNCQKCDNCLSDDKEKQDLTVPAQKFLSCVHRTEQRFGASYIIDVLRGSNAQKILQNQHNLLSTYNIGNEFTKKQWTVLSRQLIQKGLLKQDEQFGSLKLTQQAGEVLKGKVPFFALLQHATPSKDKTSKVALIDCDQVLLQAFKKERKMLADKANVPPYAIFSDRSLQEMAHYFPQSQQTLLQIHGVGQAKLEKYGDIFIALIVAHTKQFKLNEVSNSQAPSGANLTKSTDTMSSKSLAMVNKFDSGASIASIAQLQKIKPSTVLGHLYKYLQLGKKLQNTQHLLESIELSPSQLKIALDAFDEHGYERLKPIYEALNCEVDYEQLHLTRVYFLQQS